MIKFTIITCTYNAADVIKPTLDSILNQTWGQIEHLIIDGASKDDTVKVAEAYRQRSLEEETEHDVRIISEPDRGLYDAMNKGLRLATGDYVVFLNAGDSLPNDDTLEKISNDVNERSDGKLPAVLYGDTDIVDEKGIVLHPRRLAPPDKLNWRSFRHGMLVCHQAFYARTDIAKRTPFNLMYRYSADFDWCIRIMKQAEDKNLPLANSGIVLADYLKEGTTTRHHKASLGERFKIMATYYGLLTTYLLHAWFVVRAVVKR